MNLILGMDLGVFIAWIGTILAAILCILYGLYYQFIKRSEKEQKTTLHKKHDEKQVED